MNHHGKQKEKIGQRDQQFLGRYTDWRPNLLHGMSTPLFVGSRTMDSLLPPAWDPCGSGRDGEPFAQGVTHTNRRDRRFFLSKTGYKQFGCVLFGHRASLARWQQLQRLLWKGRSCSYVEC